MVTRTVPNEKHAGDQQWSDQEIERFESINTQALNHSYGRNGRVVKVLCYLSLMQSNKSLPSNCRITVEAAEFQNYSASDGMQAAHYLPGQLKINGMNASYYTNNSLASSDLDKIFGDVDSLPANFNKADSEAESKGLCKAFQSACEALVCDTSRLQSQSINRSLVTRTYQTIWIRQARLAFDAALNNKLGKYTEPPLQFGAPGGPEFNTIQNLEERESASEYQRNINEQQQILKRYYENLTEIPLELSDSRFLEIEKTFRP